MNRSLSHLSVILCYAFRTHKKKTEVNFSRIFNAMKFTWTRMLRFSFRLMPFVSDIESPLWKSRTVGTKQLFYRFARHPNWIASLPDTFKYGLWFYNVLLECILHTHEHRTSAKQEFEQKKIQITFECETKSEWIRYRKISIILCTTNKQTYTHRFE